jgi:hypothetical protein
VTPDDYSIQWVARVLEALGPLSFDDLDTRTSGLRNMSRDDLRKAVEMAVERGQTGERYAKKV